MLKFFKEDPTTQLAKALKDLNPAGVRHALNNGANPRKVPSDNDSTDVASDLLQKVRLMFDQSSDPGAKAKLKEIENIVSAKRHEPRRPAHVATLPKAAAKPTFRPGR
jgi:hypothetical protein